MALTKMTGNSSKITVKENYSDIKDLKIYLTSLKKLFSLTRKVVIQPKKRFFMDNQVIKTACLGF